VLKLRFLDKMNLLALTSVYLPVLMWNLISLGHLLQYLKDFLRTLFICNIFLFAFKERYKEITIITIQKPEKKMVRDLIKPTGLDSKLRFLPRNIVACI